MEGRFCNYLLNEGIKEGMNEVADGLGDHRRISLGGNDGEHT